MTTKDEAIRAALASDTASQTAYASQAISQIEHVSIIDSHGNVHEKDVEVFISWVTISKILNLVRERAGIN